MPVWIVGLLVVLSIVATAVAFTIADLPTEKLSFFEATIEETDFEVTEFELEIEGKNRIEVAVTLKNVGTVAHQAEVTLQALDADGNVLVEQTLSTGSVAAGATRLLDFVLTKDSLSTDLASVFLIVDQVS